MRPMEDARCFQKIRAHTGRAADIQEFLSKIVFTPTDKEDEGTTWLEMFVIYKLCGYGCPIQNSKGAEKRVSMRQQIDVFKKCVRDIIRLTCDAQDTDDFKPSKHKKPRLQGLGIQNHEFMISIRIHLSVEAQREVW